MNTNEPPVIDHARLEKLRDILGDDFQDLCASFVTSSRENIDLIGTALENGNRPEAVFIAHKQASAAAQFALPRLSQVAKTIEYGDDLSAAELQSLYRDLNDNFAIALPLLQQTTGGA